MLKIENYWFIELYRLAHIIKLVEDRARPKIKEMPSESTEEWNLAFERTKRYS